jgi:hypothetical protein
MIVSGEDCKYELNPLLSKKSRERFKCERKSRPDRNVDFQQRKVSGASGIPFWELRTIRQILGCDRIVTDSPLPALTEPHRSEMAVMKKAAMCAAFAIAGNLTVELKIRRYLVPGVRFPIPAPSEFLQT